MDALLLSLIFGILTPIARAEVAVWKLDIAWDRSMSAKWKAFLNNIAKIISSLLLVRAASRQSQRREPTAKWNGRE